MTASTTVLEPAALADPGLRGTVRVLGGPGTGKTSLLTGAAAAHIAAGVPTESVLLLTGSARLGAAARAQITATLLRSGTGVVRQPLVRTVHSYAFAVLRLAAQRGGDPPPRLITGAEQDGIIRELLAGDLEDGAASWPASLHPALGTAGFASELRDLMARCAERGVDPMALQRLGRLSGRAEWVAAGRFAQVYEQVMLLRAAVGMAAPQATVPALGAAELVGAALDALATDADLLAAERARIKLLLVDDAQHLDPQAALLVRVLAAGAGLTVIAGDPNQSVFGYRGADPALLRTDTPAITLTTSHRCSTAVAAAVSGIARRLPAAEGFGEFASGTGDPGKVSVRIAATAHAEAMVVADALRRAHLVDGVPWSQMAVVVRSVPRAGAALGRALAGAGVPVDLPAAEPVLGRQPAVHALLTVLGAAADGVTGEVALDLVTGPIGRVDPVSLRQLRRALRRLADHQRDFPDLLADAVRAVPDGLAPEHARSLQRVGAVLAAARRSRRAGEDPRSTLWQAWQRSGLQRRWVAAADRGGAAGAAAERDLDAVTALFDVAEQYVTRTTGATLRGLLDHVDGLSLPVTADRTPRGEVVAVCSAHAVLDREWDFVVIAGVQEGLWPNTMPRGGVLGTQHLVDILDGVTEPGQPVSVRAPLVAEERRLLIAAMGRARSRLLVTAVDGGAGDDDAMLPSPFCAELAELTTDDSQADSTPVAAPRLLAPAALVGRLRAVVCAPEAEVSEEVRRCAAHQLARLAEAGVAGADPASWYECTEPSTSEPLWSGAEHVVTLSPSTVQTLTDCPLRWMLERHGGSDSRDVRSAVGTLVHALVADSTRTEGQLLAELENVWAGLPYESQWYADNELARHGAMLATFAQWRELTRRQLTEVGTEVGVDGMVAPGVRVRGRIDRLERDNAGRLVIVDVKTGKSPVTKDDAQRHAQLAMYQLAIAEGVLPQGDEPGGGVLVYPGKPSAGGATERTQDALTSDAAAGWRDQVVAAAAATQGPTFVARVNDNCGHCPVRAMCPAHQRGEGQ
ncbi:ATP-dependent DNA helicase [Mycolicibacterium sp. 120266]|uniref:ATP-dependent DNA helicase n=1 Tax=Mycolicibacterium sp. 120266 TaxID=3090601 RepID=UPI00299F248F|nr:ATP-dependent DNA helicase [Mycolicibacterium sp. 120266]MDX1874400.1 ATP-dependent DNA helicase [Mycolicibacterium sp. 120266]